MERFIIWIASNWFVLLFVVAVCTSAAKLRRRGLSPFTAGAAYVFWGELLFYAVGIWFLYTGVLHAYFQQIVALRIGWQPSPFEYELGWMEIPLSLTAMLSLWRGAEFRLATTMIVVPFALACAAQHIRQILCCANHSESNAGLVLWFADIIIPLLLAALAAISKSSRTAFSSASK